MIFALLAVIVFMFIFLLVMENKLHKYLSIIHEHQAELASLLEHNKKFIVQNNGYLFKLKVELENN